VLLWGAREGRTSFSEEKEAKRLLIIFDRGGAATMAQINKSFLVLFFKKERLAFF